MTLLAVSFGLFGSAAYQAHVQRRAVRTIQRAGGTVAYDFDRNSGTGWVRTRVGCPVPAWLVDALGPDMFGKVHFIFLQWDMFSGDSLDDVDFASCPNLVFTAGSLLDANAISKISTLNQLRELSLDDCGITNELLEGLSKLTSLESLHLHNNPINRRGLEHLSKMRTLRELMIGKTQIAGEDLNLLSELQSLKYLDLSGLAIKDGDLKALSSLASIKGVYLQNTGITKEGLQHLWDLPSLERVELSNTGIDDTTRADFQKQLDARRRKVQKPAD